MLHKVEHYTKMNSHQLVTVIGSKKKTKATQNPKQFTLTSNYFNTIGGLSDEKL
jgi:hypothetical protein